ncbi:hypothetical protein [Cupriavidus nantongensis]|uniref:Uncharacterized protein n=1 Tax=Cupriavidus nantongensis TaxID=1796606 RepID=A0A142JKE6_9BURK|nr:hypothetical protein [Cupriavidus nantongensis]AMR78558.1 hypothetical protein A2G96_12855 [Cupriavidus nantongensis]
MPPKIQGFHTAHSDMVTNPNGRADSHLVTCRVCRMSFVTSEAKDVRSHEAEHAALAQGSMPMVARELLKTVGWNLAYQDRPLDLARYTAEDGKLAIVYGWWMRALYRGVSPSEFDAYMAEHLRLVDSIVAGTDNELSPERCATKRWEKYAG